MNILIIGKFYPESFARIISENLEEMNHKVLEYNIQPKYRYTTNLFYTRWAQIKRNIYFMTRNIPSILVSEYTRLFKLLQTAKVDLTIINHDYLIPELVDKIKESTNAPIILWHPDHFASSGNFKFLNCNYDFMFFEDPYMVHIFKREFNKNAFYLPECFSPKYMSKPEISETDRITYGCDISTVGSPHSSRISVFKHLKDYDVKIWGVRPPLWMDVRDIKQMFTNKTVLGIDKAKAFKAARIVLNTVFPANVWGINGRAFEAAGSGSFQIISWRLGLKDLFKEGSEIAFYKNINDMKEKINYYLANEKERDKIAEAGYKRAIKDHTYRIRLEVLLSTVFNGSQGEAMPDIDYNLF